MKRIISFVLITAFVVSMLVGCSCDNTKKAKKSEKVQTTTVAWNKGESLYGSKIREYVKACEQNGKVKEKNKLSTGLGEMANEKDLMNKVGYTFLDLDGDGTEELLVSVIDKDSKMTSYIIAAYSYTSDGIKRLLEGWSRNSYYRVNMNYLLNEASGGALNTENSKIHMRDGGFEIISSLVIKEGKKNKPKYLYAEQGKPKNTKEFTVSEDQWNSTLEAWEDEIKTDNVKALSEFK